MIVIDAQHRLLRANPAAESMLNPLGYHVGDVLRGIAAQVMTAEGGEVLAVEDRPVERALRGETVIRQVVDVDYGDGSGLHRMVLSAQPLEVADDGELGAC